MSWQIAVLLLRRHPHTLRLVETHPGGGTYDCLTLYDRADHSRGDIYLNRDGSATIFKRFDGSNPEDETTQWRSIWPETVAVGPLAVVAELERMSGLPEITKLPPSSAEILGFRLIAALLTAKAFSVTPWECRMGYTDTSGHFVGDAIRVDLFEPFPELRRRLEIRQDDDFLGLPAYRFWFLIRENEPMLGLEASTGVVETIGRGLHDVMDLYRNAGRRLWPTVWEVAGHLL